MGDAERSDKPAEVAEKEDRTYLDAMREMLHGERAVFDYLYDCLSIIDRKSASLLQFNSIILAATTVLLVLLAQREPRTQPWYEIAAICSALSLLLMSISSTVSLLAVRIYWGTKAIDDPQFDRELLRRRKWRTRRYRVSWWISICTLPVFVVDLVAIFVVYGIW